MRRQRTIAVTGIALAFAATLPPAASDAGPVLASMRVPKGSVEWAGILLGMSKGEVEGVLERSIHLARSTRGDGPPYARVVVDGRPVHLTFWEINGDLILRGLVLERTGFDTPES